MFTIIGRMRQYIEICALKEYIGVNYENDAKVAYQYIFPNKNEDYVDPDFYSQLLYKTWGDLLKKKGVIESYRILVKNYRYVIEVKYLYRQCQKKKILGSDGLMSIGKCNDDIEKHKNIGGFALWPSHRGGINFRKNRYQDDIFKTLEDIEMFYKDAKKYKGVIPRRDYEWFEYLGTKGGFSDIFFFRHHDSYGDVLSFENYRTNEIIHFLSS